MAVVYTKQDQGLTITVGNGVPVHSGVDGDKYSDITSGILYTYSNGGWKSTTLPSVQTVVSSASITASKSAIRLKCKLLLPWLICSAAKQT